MKMGNGVTFRARLGDLLVSTPPWNAVTHGLFVCLSDRGYGSDSDVIHGYGRKTAKKNMAIYRFLFPLLSLLSLYLTYSMLA